MQVELFSADCRLCQATEASLRHRFPEVALEVHLASECVDGSCCALAEEYGVRAAPSVVVDGRVVLVGRPQEADWAELSTVLVG